MKYNRIQIGETYRVKDECDLCHGMRNIGYANQKMKDISTLVTVKKIYKGDDGIEYVEIENHPDFYKHYKERIITPNPMPLKIFGICVKKYKKERDNENK